MSYQGQEVVLSQYTVTLDLESSVLLSTVMIHHQAPVDGRPLNFTIVFTYGNWSEGQLRIFEKTESMGGSQASMTAEPFT